MQGPSLTSKKIIFLSLLISSLIHLTVLYNFIFVFPIQAIKNKPNFIFIGSILQRRDTSMSKTIDWLQQKQYYSKETIIEPITIIDNFMPIKNIQKPRLIKEKKMDEKIILKDTFEADIHEDLKEVERGDNLNLDLPSTSYKPLRIRSQ